VCQSQDHLTWSGRTFVDDVVEKKLVMSIDRVMVLPPGSESELTSPDTLAKVVGVRLLVGFDRQPATVRLDVVVPEHWWDDARPASLGTWRGAIQPRDNPSELLSAHSSGRSRAGGGGG
jgi:hypothetical protein